MCPPPAPAHPDLPSNPVAGSRPSTRGVAQQSRNASCGKLPSSERREPGHRGTPRHSRQLSRAWDAHRTIDAAEATVPVTSHSETYHVDLHVANGGVSVRLRLDAGRDRDHCPPVRQRWFVGVINGGSTADVTLPLSFLGSGSWSAVELFDQPGKLDAWDRKAQRVSGADSIALHLISRGGFVAEITAKLQRADRCTRRSSRLPRGCDVVRRISSCVSTFNSAIGLPSTQRHSACTAASAICFLDIITEVSMGKM